MSDGTKIEWTDATWNPITGCSVVSPGCTNCYAMTLAGTRLQHHPSRAGLTKMSKAGPVWTGEVRFNEQWLDQPMRWKRPRMIFVCAHADLFHESVPDEWIDKVFAVMALAEWHTFQVLTKRPERMRAYFDGRRRDFGRCSDVLGDLEHGLSEGRHDAAVEMLDLFDIMDKPQGNVWLGVSVEDQTRADERVPILLDTPAAVRWVSAEPLLGPVGIEQWLHDSDCRLSSEGVCTCSEPREVGIDWVVAGGESGPGARPMHPDWARSLRDQCLAGLVPFHFKQWGDWLPGQNDDYDGLGGRRSVAHWQDGSWGPRDASRPDQNYVMWSPDGTLHRGGSRRGGGYFEVAAWAQRVGKHAAGRLLDGREWNGWPGQSTPSRSAA